MKEMSSNSFFVLFTPYIFMLNNTKNVINKNDNFLSNIREIKSLKLHKKNVTFIFKTIFNENSFTKSFFF